MTRRCRSPRLHPDADALNLSMDGRSVSRPAWIIVPMLFLVVLLSGCAENRSVEAYCNTLERHKQSYLQAMEAAAEPSNAADVLGGIAAIGDLTSMWREMADVAPEEIRSDTEAVRDAWIKMEDSAVAGNWGGAVVLAGLLNAGPMNRVDAYVRQYCDQPASP